MIALCDLEAFVPEVALFIPARSDSPCFRPHVSPPLPAIEKK